MFKFELGQQATVSQFGVTGVVCSHTAHLNGGRQYSLQYVDTNGVIHLEPIKEHMLEPIEGEATADIPYGFKFQLGAGVVMLMTGTQAKVIGAHRAWHGQTQYCVIFAGAGLQEQWLEESLLRTRDF